MKVHNSGLISSLIAKYEFGYFSIVAFYPGGARGMPLIKLKELERLMPYSDRLAFPAPRNLFMQKGSLRLSMK